MIHELIIYVFFFLITLVGGGSWLAHTYVTAHIADRRKKALEEQYAGPIDSRCTCNHGFNYHAAVCQVKRCPCVTFVPMISDPDMVSDYIKPQLALEAPTTVQAKAVSDFIKALPYGAKWDQESLAQRFRREQSGQRAISGEVIDSR